MYIVTALKAAQAIDLAGQDVSLAVGDATYIRSSDVARYRKHPDVFQVSEVSPTGMNADNTGLIDPTTGLTLSMLGSNVITVGSGGVYATLADAIAAIAPSGNGYDLAVARFTRTETISVASGGTVVTGSGTNWQGTGAVIPGYVGDLWKPAAATKYYRIKSIDSDTQFTLWEPYTDTAIVATATAYSAYYLNRKTILMLPGHHQVSGVALAMGVDITSLHRASVVISEISGSPATPFTEMYDARLSNLTFAASAHWGDMDGVSNTGHTCPLGSVITHRNIRVRCANDGQAHQGGSLRLPGASGSTVIYDGCVIESAKTPTIVFGTRVAETIANTRVIFKGGTELRTVRDADTNTASTIIQPAGILIDTAGTYDFIGTTAEVPDDLNVDSLVGNVGSIYVGAAAVVNLHGHRGRSTNSNVGANAYCLETTAAATVNIFASDLEASGTDGTAIVCGGGATINIRTGSRIKGSTNSIDCASGTVNVSGNADLIGATTGAGTINLATAS